MYVNPFGFGIFVGVIATVVAEIAVALCCTSKKHK